PAAGAVKELAAGVGDLGPVDVDGVVMEALVQGPRGADPGAVLAPRQRGPAAQAHPHALRLGRDDAEAGAAFGIHLRVLLARLIGGRRFEILLRLRGRGW